MRFSRHWRKVCVFLIVLGLIGSVGWYASGGKADVLRWRAERFLKADDPERAVLLARSAVLLAPESVSLGKVLADAYDASGDPRLLDMLAQDEDEALRRTIKALEFGLFRQARQSFFQLVPGDTVDAVTYHEMGLYLFSDDAQVFYDHARAAAELQPEDAVALVRLGLASIRAGRVFPQGLLGRLRQLAEKRHDTLGADAAAVSLTLALLFPDEAEALGSSTYLTGLLQLRIEQSEELRASFLRSFEVSRQLSPSSAWGILSSMQAVCASRRDVKATRKLAECLTRLGMSEVLLAWFEESSEAFPEVEAIQTEAAFVRLLVVDVAAQENRWDVVEEALGEAPSDHWGEFRFLREFYAGRLMRERDRGDLRLVDREREILATMRFAQAEEDASQPWQRAVLAELSRKYL